MPSFLSGLHSPAQLGSKSGFDRERRHLPSSASFTISERCLHRIEKREGSGRTAQGVRDVIPVSKPVVNSTMRGCRAAISRYLLSRPEARGPLHRRCERAEIDVEVNPFRSSPLKPWFRLPSRHIRIQRAAHTLCDLSSPCEMRSPRYTHTAGSGTSTPMPAQMKKLVGVGPEREDYARPDCREVRDCCINGDRRRQVVVVHRPSRNNRALTVDGALGPAREISREDEQPLMSQSWHAE